MYKTHTQVCYGLQGHSIRVMVFILYKLYVLFLLSPHKTHSVWFISVLNYGDTENVLINHLLLVKLVILSRIKPLWLPPSSTKGISHPSTNQFIRTSIPTNPVPGTDHPYRCQSLAGLLKLSSLTHQCEVLFCPADISECYPVSITCCLPHLFTHSDCLPPARDPACLAFTLSPVCRLPRPLAFSPFTIQPFYDIPDAVTRSVPVWLVVPLIKLLKNPNATYSVLQKTSPDIDPAVFYRFTTEVSAQATVLATQQQQLNYLTSLTEELVRSLRALLLPAPSMNASPQNPPPPASSTASMTVSPRLAFPEKFDGSPTKCKGFLLQLLHVYHPAAHAISHGRQPHCFRLFVINRTSEE